MNIQKILKLTADMRAILDGRPSGFIDIDAENHPERFTLVFRINQLNSFGIAQGAGQFIDLGNNCVPC
jgi:hypothetical protein